MSEAFLIFVLQHYKSGKQQISVKKRKKIYPLDPLLYRTFGHTTGIAPEFRDLSGLVEMVVGQNAFIIYRSK